MDEQTHVPEGQSIAEKVEMLRSLARSQVSLVFSLRWRRCWFRRGYWLLEFEEDSGLQGAVVVPDLLLSSLTFALPRSRDPLVLDWEYGCALRQASWEIGTIQTSWRVGGTSDDRREQGMSYALKLVNGERDPYWVTLQNALDD